ncbi:hypothetical protein DSAG12_01940 [Promethearchaeum syntrophicum]|uniref:Transposase DDE domain protein n=1 Tax=Promethearchaeum syntrophicum TaxID=2594042 RepID=A0A5B9DAR8_9ARCH|nr:hypothetical protein [Candidatus Prometheoarchaeum syntrophicum]QEE16111.1 hypothetical protein DSAG12_01940 [Candidatus Prometheoarchaeum syntrophicum]
MYQEVSSISSLDNEQLHLVFSEQLDLLGLTSKQKRKVNSSQNTKERVILTLISSMLTKSSLEIGKKHLNVISTSIYSVLSSIKASQDTDTALNNAIEIFMPESRKFPLSASRQAVTDNVIQDSKPNLDDKLNENYTACMKELNEFNGKSKEVILAIDTTPEETRSKYLNDQYSFVHIGQNNTWKRGFTYSSVYDCTNQLFISTLHQNYHKPKYENTTIQAFIGQLQNSCKIVEGAGSEVKFIDADRGYYNGELFTAAYFNQISSKCKHNDNIRVIVPKKFAREKVRKKVAFLEDPNSKEVFMDYINLSKYTHPSLKGYCEASEMKTYDSMYHIPVVLVAVVDGYQTNRNRKLKDLKHEWMVTKKNIKSSEDRIDEYQKEYIDLQKQAGIKNPSIIKKITQRKRTKFRNSQLYKKYKQIIKSMEYLKKLKKNQTLMLNSLMFFTISSTIDEAIKHNTDYFIKLAQVYHERWSIENGFKEGKAKFVRLSRSRKSTQRQWNLELGMILYNRWHVARMRMMLEQERKKVWNKVSWEPRSPYIRRKFEQRYSSILSAESYLLQLLEYGIRIRIEKLLI